MGFFFCIIFFFTLVGSISHVFFELYTSFVHGCIPLMHFQCKTITYLKKIKIKINKKVITTLTKHNSSTNIQFTTNSPPPLKGPFNNGTAHDYWDRCTPHRTTIWIATIRILRSRSWFPRRIRILNIRTKREEDK